MIHTNQCILDSVKNWNKIGMQKKFFYELYNHLALRVARRVGRGAVNIKKGMKLTKIICSK